MKIKIIFLISFLTLLETNADSSKIQVNIRDFQGTHTIIVRDINTQIHIDFGQQVSKLSRKFRKGRGYGDMSCLGKQQAGHGNLVYRLKNDGDYPWHTGVCARKIMFTDDKNHKHQFDLEIYYHGYDEFKLPFPLYLGSLDKQPYHFYADETTLARRLELNRVDYERSFKTISSAKDCVVKRISKHPDVSRDYEIVMSKDISLCHFTMKGSKILNQPEVQNIYLHRAFSFKSQSLQRMRSRSLNTINESYTENRLELFKRTNYLILDMRFDKQKSEYYSVNTSNSVLTGYKCKKQESVVQHEVDFAKLSHSYGFDFSGPDYGTAYNPKCRVETGRGFNAKQLKASLKIIDLAYLSKADFNKWPTPSEPESYCRIIKTERVQLYTKQYTNPVDRNFTDLILDIADDTKSLEIHGKCKSVDLRDYVNWASN